MDRDEWERRGSSFGAVAAAYARHRPDYPEAAARWCLDPVGQDITRLRVLDLGAGTGKLTALLVRLGADVTAVEPDTAMLAELRRRLPGVRALPGSAEAIPVEDGSVDAVLCGQAMHWFDMERAAPQIARVLVPGGVLAGLWNSDDDQVEWVAGLQTATRGAGSRSLSEWRTRTAGSMEAQVGQAVAFFSGTERAEFPHGHRRTAGSLLAGVATHSKVLVMTPDERERLLADVARYLASRPETADGEFTLPIITGVVRAIRRRPDA